MDGQFGHGVSRVSSYCMQARSGKIKGNAIPQVVAETATAMRIDAGTGFAFPAIDLAIRELPKRLSQRASQQQLFFVRIILESRVGMSNVWRSREPSVGLLVTVPRLFRRLADLNRFLEPIQSLLHPHG